MADKSTLHSMGNLVAADIARSITLTSGRFWDINGKTGVFTLGFVIDWYLIRNTAKTFYHPSWPLSRFAYFDALIQEF